METPLQPRKTEEFRALLKAIKNSQVKGHWVNLAHALGVHPSTISMWKKHPEAQKAIVETIAEAIKQMEQAGRDDWRMWMEKLRMLGGIPEEKGAAVQVNINPAQAKQDVGVVLEGVLTE